MALLPPSPKPFVAPTDRDMLPSERRTFVMTHGACVFGYARRKDGPSMSVVGYVPDDLGTIHIATMAERQKAKAVSRSGKVSVCVLDTRWPFAYLQVYCDAMVVTDAKFVCDVMMAIGWRMSGRELPDSAREAVNEMRVREDRVVLKCVPYATFGQPPRHLHRNDQAERITHWLSGSVPWNAEDP